MIAAVVGIAVPFIVLWRRHVALKATKSWSTRPLTPHEIAHLRWRGRLSIWLFVLFWIVALALIIATTVAGASSTVQRIVVIAVLGMAAIEIAFHLSVRCPVCNFRLGYQRTIGVPPI
jgi:hypothetical protein